MQCFYYLACQKCACFSREQPVREREKWISKGGATTLSFAMNLILLYSLHQGISLWNSDCSLQYF